MSGFRAKDADRDRYVDIIESAYVDGQLGDEDRELRVSRALTAATLDELDALTRDLQNRPPPTSVVPPGPAPAPVPVVPAPAPAPARPTPWPVPPKDRTPARAVGVVVAGIFAFAVFSMASADPQPAVLDYATVPSDRSGSTSGYRMTAAEVRTFLRRYEAKFDTTDAYEIRFFPDRVVAHVPVSEPSPRFAQWTWDGVWRRDGQARSAGAPTGPVDLRALDAGALLDNIDVATSGLGVRDADLQRVVVREASDGQALVSIHVRNGTMASARLETTLQGSRVRAVPYDG